MSNMFREMLKAGNQEIMGSDKKERFSFIKTMPVYEYLTKYDFAVDLSYQRPFVAKEEFVSSILSNVYHVERNDKINGNEKYRSNLQTIGGKMLNKLFNLADGQQRTNVLQLIFLVLAFFAKKQGNTRVATLSMILFSKERSIDFSDMNKFINMKYKNTNLDYDSEYERAVADYVSFYSRSGNDYEVYDIPKSLKSNKYSLTIQQIHKEVNDLLVNYSLDYIYKVIALRSFITVVELPKYISEADFFREKNSPANIQNEEDLCKVVCMTSKMTKKQTTKVVSKIMELDSIINRVVSNKEQGKFKRHLFRATYMSLKFTSIEHCKVISVENTATENKISKELDLSLRMGDFNALTFYNKAVEFASIFEKIVNSKIDKDSIYLPVRNFLYQVGETKYRFLPAFLEVSSYIESGKFIPDYIEFNNWVLDSTAYLVPRSVSIGSNTEKAADAPFADLIFYIKNTRNIGEVRVEFKKVLEKSNLLVAREMFETDMRNLKPISSNFSGLAAYLYEVSFIKKHSKNLEEDLKFYNLKFASSHIDHMIPKNNSKLLEELSLESEVEMIIDTLLTQYSASAANFGSLPKKYNAIKSNKFPYEFREKIISMQESVNEAYKDAILPKKEDFVSYESLKSCLSDRIEQFISLVTPNMSFK